MLEELNSKKKDSNDDANEESGHDDGKRKATEHAGQRKSKKHKSSGVGFKPMAQRVAAKWKNLDRKALSYYEELAANDLQRYKAEMSEWREKKRMSGKESPRDDLDEEDSHN